MEEQIYRTDSFPDPTYERIYWVHSDSRTFELGRYSDEAANGMHVPPLMVGDWLVVMSSAHIFFWQPGQDVRHFYPYVVDDWIAYAQRRQLNGHYDYAAAGVEIDGATWRITYTCTSCLRGHPPELGFVSEDGGETFRLE